MSVDPLESVVKDAVLAETRRQFFARGGSVVGAAALASLFARDEAKAAPALPGFPHFKPAAKRVIYLHLVGAPGLGH